MSPSLRDNVVRALSDAVDADRDAMRDLLAALVAIPTENPPATGYRPCVALLESTLERLGFPYERIAIPIAGRIPTKISTPKSGGFSRSSTPRVPTVLICTST